MNDTSTDPPYLLTEEAAVYLRVSPRTLEKWRLEEKGPAYSTVGNRPVYTIADLDAYVTANRKEPQS